MRIESRPVVRLISIVEFWCFVFENCSVYKSLQSEGIIIAFVLDCCRMAVFLWLDLLRESCCRHDKMPLAESFVWRFIKAAYGESQNKWKDREFLKTKGLGLVAVSILRDSNGPLKMPLIHQSVFLL